MYMRCNQENVKYADFYMKFGLQLDIPEVDANGRYRWELMHQNDTVLVLLFGRRIRFIF